MGREAAWSQGKKAGEEPDLGCCLGATSCLLFGVHPSTWLRVPASGEGCEDGGVRVVCVEAYEAPSANGSDSFRMRRAVGRMSKNARTGMQIGGP